MRKLKLQMQISIDGFVSTGPNDEQQWVTWAWSEIKDEVFTLMDSTDTMIIGRKLAVDFIPYWEGVVNEPGHEMHGLATRNVSSRKIIFSKTLKEANWKNAGINHGDLVKEVTALKEQTGKDIAVCGGSSFVSALIANDLIDEFYLYINPVAIGKGEPIFGLVDGFKRFKVLRTRTFNSGLILAHYDLAR